MELSSESFDDGDLIPPRHAHDRDNLSPSLTWDVIPPDTAELVLLCQDPDAPSGTFTHWVLAGLDPTTTELAEGDEPAGAISGTNDFGERGWGGPEPPVGDPAHRYVFTVFASAVPLDIAPGVVADDLLAALDDNELARGQLIGYYQR